MNRVLRIREEDRAIFAALVDGSKRIETRAASPKYRDLKEGDTLIFSCGADRLETTIARAYRWPSIVAMFGDIAYTDVFPDAVSVDDAASRWDAFPGDAEKIRAYGLVGWEMR